MRWVAFLRGINSGRNPSTKMEVLREGFAKMGFSDVKTVIASGNVVFDTNETDGKKLEGKIEKELSGILGFESGAVVRSVEGLRRLVEKDPFAGIEVSKKVKPYVTLVKDAKSNLTYPVKGEGYTILGVYGNQVCSVVNLAKASSPDLMKVLDREFGKKSTTRGMSTIERVIKVG